MERCPICRATWRGEDHCRRCGADLRLLARIVDLGENLEKEAVRHILAGRFPQAQERLRQARFLRDTPLNRALWTFLA